MCEQTACEAQGTYVDEQAQGCCETSAAGI